MKRSTTPIRVLPGGIGTSVAWRITANRSKIRGATWVQEVILASGSPRRAALLKQIGVPHRVFVPTITEEAGQDGDPAALVVSLALRKLRNVAASVNSGLIVAADTLVFAEEPLGKPRNAEEAAATLTRLAGREHTVLTGVAILHKENHELRTGVGHARVSMRDMSEREIRAYVRTGEPMDKAGSYSVQGLGARFVKEVCGDYYAVVGLPLELTSRLLSELGYDFE